jgi:lysine 2,3-aminomutase
MDIPGGHGKSPIGPSYLARNPAAEAGARDAWTVEDYTGTRHPYPEG